MDLLALVFSSSWFISQAKHPVYWVHRDHPTQEARQG